MEFSHKPVMLMQAVDGLNVFENGIYVDGTAGGGGHSAEILKRLKYGKLISIDQDPDAIKAVRKRFGNNENSVIMKGNFQDMDKLLAERGIFQVNGILLDIGVSSHQLDTVERGFSFHEEGPLDMRMSQRGLSARDIVNNYEYKDLARIISQYGEEKYASSISRGIINARAIKPIETTVELAEIIKENVPQKVRRDGHPARKTFQALRIAVNDELGVLERAVDKAFDLLCSGGRLVIITFHSLEDRIVKQKMAKFCEGCTCPKDFPVCVCGNKPKAKLVNRKPITADEDEILENPRSRSAKLRILEKL